MSSGPAEQEPVPGLPTGKVHASGHEEGRSVHKVQLNDRNFNR